MNGKSKTREGFAEQAPEVTGRQPSPATITEQKLDPDMLDQLVKMGLKIEREEFKKRMRTPLDIGPK